MQIRWTKSASQNLDHIENYIAEENSAAAIDIVFRIFQAVEMLATHPHIGRPGRIIGIRELVISGTPFIVPYRVKDNFVEILRVFHTAMQWPDIL